jgi:hypothetical protein
MPGEKLILVSLNDVGMLIATECDVDDRSSNRTQAKRRAAADAQLLAAAKFPPLPKSVIQQFGTDLASFDYQLDLDATR